MANKISDAAKAAAVMHFVSDEGNTGLTPERAVALFDELGATHGPVDDVLEKFDTVRWAAFDFLTDAEWWESLELLALSIDLMFDHFEFRSKEQVNG